MINASLLTVTLAALFGYLLGSIPFGFVLTKLAGLGDIRKIGSGSIGATNVLRTGNKKIAALTMVLDTLKGAVAVLVIEQIDPSMMQLVALAVLVGHIFPVWLKFKGGKGVATAEGIMMALCWPAGLAIATVWVLVLKFSKLSSLAALVAVTLSSSAVWAFGREDLVCLTLILTLLIYWTHRANIRRLISGTEPKVGQNKNATPPPQ